MIFFKGIGSLFSALKVVRLLRLGRVVRKLDRWIIFSNDPRIVIIIVIILIIILHINVNICNGWYLQISGVRSSNADIAAVFFSPRGSLAGLYILLHWSEPPPSSPADQLCNSANFQATRTFTTGWSLAGSTLCRSPLASLTPMKFNTLTITEQFTRLR